MFEGRKWRRERVDVAAWIEERWRETNVDIGLQWNEWRWYSLYYFPSVVFQVGSDVWPQQIAGLAAEIWEPLSMCWFLAAGFSFWHTQCCFSMLLFKASFSFGDAGGGSNGRGTPSVFLHHVIWMESWANCTLTQPDFVAGKWFSQQHNDWRPVQQIFTNIVHQRQVSSERSQYCTKLQSIVLEFPDTPRHTESAALHQHLSGMKCAACSWLAVAEPFSLSLPSFKMHCRFRGNVTVIRTRPLAKCQASWTADAARAGLKEGNRSCVSDWQL